MNPYVFIGSQKFQLFAKNRKIDKKNSSLGFYFEVVLKFLKVLIFIFQFKIQFNKLFLCLMLEMFEINL